MNEGPKVFVSRLMNLITKDITIYNPSIKDYKLFKKNNHKNNLILRLDGITYYRFNNVSLSNYLSKLGHNRILIRIIKKYFPQRDSKYFNYLFNFYINRISFIYLKSGHKIVFQSFLSLEMHKFLFKKLNWNKINYKIILNGIDVNNFANALPAKLDGDPRVIISASMFRINKRLFEAINLINYLRDMYPNIHLHVIGNLDILVENQMEHLDLSSITFHGLIKVEKLSSFYLGCDMQLSLSIFDPCPNVVIEGLACGLPVITPKQSGASELIGNTNHSWSVDEDIAFGFYFLHDKKKFIPFNYDAYIKVFTNVYENLVLNKIKAKKRSNDLDINKISDQYLSFFCDV